MIQQFKFSETLHSGYAQTFEVREVLFEHRTEHQHLVIFDTPSFGRVMALDGAIQTTERDEFIYHEMLAHVPLFAHGQARDVLIVGGGDGGMLREVLKHPGVERVVMVEIDRSVIDLCTHYFPNHSQGAFDSPRAEIIVGDGVEYVGSTDRRFDVVLSDSTDPAGPAEVLFTERFYSGVKRCLKEGGIFAAQNGLPFLQADEVTNTYKRLAGHFQDRWFFAAAVPTYVGGIMTLAWASDDKALRQLPVEVIAERFRAGGLKTRYYNPEMHVASFALPQYVVDSLVD
ncbi:MAG: polyamine aminopropyltransferase [Spongiibacteraceae bacterium]|nr:polyamine aminopropyltransferase [Spongiibacteraceae bacterium]